MMRNPSFTRPAVTGQGLGQTRPSPLTGWRLAAPAALPPNSGGTHR